MNPLLVVVLAPLSLMEIFIELNFKVPTFRGGATIGAIG